MPVATEGGGGGKGKQRNKGSKVRKRKRDRQRYPNGELEVLHVLLLRSDDLLHGLLSMPLPPLLFGLSLSALLGPLRLFL
jgi:hypothetical protein